MFNTLQKHKTMKRLLTIGLMLVSAFALTNCAEEITAPVQDDITVDGNIENNTPPEEEVNIPFEVFATVGGEAETKTQNIGNGTYWVCEDDKKDQISVFHYNHESAKSTAISKMTHNKPFTIKDVKGIFEGGLSNTLGDTNDWYFIYPYNSEYTYSSSGPTLTVKGVQIGKAEWTGVVPGNKSHIAGEASPMYGCLSDRPRNEQPKIEMSHLAAVVGIKVVNKTESPILVRDVEFAVPYISHKDENYKDVVDQVAYPIVGKFNITFNGNTPSAEAYGESILSASKVTLKDDVYLSNVDGQNEMIVYIPVRPFEAKGKQLSIKINGSSRVIKITKEVSLKSGTVTTFKVPVETLDITPLETNAFNLKSTNDKDRKNQVQVLTIDGTNLAPTGSPITINGSLVTDVYQVGGEGSSGTITIYGHAKEMVNAMPISFYASGKDGLPTAMTIGSIDVWMPEYNNKSWSTKKDYSSIKELDHISEVSILGVPVIGALIKKAVETKGLYLDDGIQRSELLKFVHPRNITFSNIKNNAYFKAENVVVLDEANTNKSIQTTTVDSFLTKFQFGNDIPSFVGLWAILNATYSNDTFSYPDSATINDITYTESQLQTEADETANGIYNKLSDALGEYLIQIICSDASHLKHVLRDVVVKIQIENYAYADTYTPSDEYDDADCNPIIFWGLHYGE